MNQISQPGHPKDFGHEFNYAAWTANNIFTLCNVPWDSEYRDVASFRSHDDLNRYIDQRQSPRIEIRGTRAKINMPVRVGMTLGKAMQYNYLRVQNGLQPVTSGDVQQSLYYFVVGLREINPETTELVLQLDLWATFMPQITGCRGFLERGHMGIANTKAFTNYGRDYLSVPEGFDTGSEYVGVDVVNRPLMSAKPDTSSLNVIVLFASDPTAPAFKTVNGQQVPNYTSATGSSFQGIPSGATVRVWGSLPAFQQWMSEQRDTPWRTQSILSILLVPPLGQYFNNWTPPSHEPQNGYEPPSIPPSQVSSTAKVGWRESLRAKLPARYRHLSKFLTAPYTVVELTTLAGTPIMLRPENWNDGDASVIIRGNFMPPNARLQIAPKGYNANGSVNGESIDGAFTRFPDDDGGSYWDLFTQITNFPSMAIVNDGAILALANQANGLSYAHQSADWSQQKTMRATQTAYDQASSGIAASSDQLMIEQQGAATQNRIAQSAMRRQAVAGLASGVGGGISTGAFAGPAGALAGGAGSIIGGPGQAASLAIQVDTMNDQLAATWDTQNAANARGADQAGYIRDSNADLARFAAKGDYESAISGIQARVQDTMMTPASVVGQVGSELTNLINGTFGYSVRWRMLAPAMMRAVGEHWLRYGYAVQQFTRIPATFRVMSRFTYWKMSETYIQGAHIPEAYRQGLRGIIEKGTTVWTNPDDIVNPNFDIADNEPLENVSLP